MAFFQLLLKAEKVEKARLRYEDEKLRSIEISEGVKPRITLKQRLRRKRLKCIVFLLLPQFFSKRGRQALIAYAFILTITGPGKNTLHNTSILSESLVCGQEQLKQAVKSVIDLIKEPFYALRDAISKVIKTVKVVVKKIKRTLVAIKRLVLSILRVITSVFQWLGSIVNICNKKLGTPFDRCQRVFDGAVADCKAKLGPLFGGICNLTYIVGALCYVVKPLDFICMLVSYVADTIVNAVRKKIKRFTRHIKAMFYVKVKFSHSFHFETNQSKTLEDVSTGIITEVRSRTDKFLALFDWMSFMATFFILFMLLRIIHYRHKWLTNDRFDNQYLTDDLRTIDLIRTRQEKETILPLNRRERNQYIPLTSITLIKVEKVKLAKSAVFLCLTTFKICIHMMADYSLYWILSTIRFHGRIETKVQRPNFVGVYVSGNGYLADLYRSIVKAFTPHAKDAEIDMTPCLPDPIPPDLDRYTQIMTLIGFCWIMAIFEPYGLRLRHIVMCKYHPERAKQRAAWLYNHIIRSRGSFLKFARRQLRRKFGMNEDERIERVTFRERCLAICPFLNKLLPRKQNMCLLCGAVERSDQEPHIKCATPDCVGLFCIQCFADLQNLCTICRSPIDYGDLSDISEEKDSSDDQLIAKKEPVTIDIYKEKEPIMEEKPKEEIIQEEEIPEERIEEKLPEEGIPEEKLEEKMEEKLPEEKILEEKVPEEKILEEKIEKVIIEKEDKAVQTDDDIDESSSDSIYSYTYQERSSQEIEIERCKTPFKDIEAQKIREDVTIQIFNDPLAKEITSSSEDPTSCFVVRARRRLRTRLKRKSCSSPRKDDSNSSTSIANTESWPTEELDEEEVVHIEMDDGSNELLLKDGLAKEKKRSRVRRVLAALTKIPWLGKETKIDSDSEWRTKKPSLVDRIIRMLPRTQSVSPVGTNIYRRIRRKEAKRKVPSSTSSSTSDEENEQGALLKTHDRQVDCLQIISDHDDSEDNIYNRNYDSHRARRRTICRQPESHVRADDVKLKYPHEKKFTTKKLPRYLQPISKDMLYFEVDEIKDSQLKRRCVHLGKRINVLSDTKTCFDNQETNKLNVSSDYTRIACTCTSQIFCDNKKDIEVCHSEMNITTEHNNEISETKRMSKADKELLTIDWRKSGKKMGEIVTTEGTSIGAEIDIETDRQKIPEKVVIKDDRRKSLSKTDEAIIESNNIEKEKNEKKYSAKKEQAKDLGARKDVKTLKPMYEKYEEECSIIHKPKQGFQSESFSETSSICIYPGKYHRPDISTSTDEITD
ncbi:DC-STAMP domain-containing protein 2 [Camponotus floridanus]|uniref:DC-STAMP domain-containing protein 2 n=1 Tax=Camponotus floridanus TaxID=104421 RepID=E2A5K7_CAMFO|nr:DC-STAMP domain-containing protein 2 [Camponotus floridanus]